MLKIPYSPEQALPVNASIFVIDLLAFKESACPGDYAILQFFHYFLHFCLFTFLERDYQRWFDEEMEKQELTTQQGREMKRSK